MDVFGPLKRTKRGNKYVLVIMDYATKWPEAFPLKMVDSETVARTLIEVFARVGIPDEILTDNGSNFTSKLMEKFHALTGVKHIRTSAYHPETDGMVERFNATLKKTLRKLVDKSTEDWDLCLPYLMWAYRGTEHASTGYSPYELVYGKEMRDGLDELAERWKEDTTDPVPVVEYLRLLRERMERVRESMRENEQKAKTQHKKYHDRKTTTRDFKEGDMVLVFLPKKQNKLLTEWLGPYPILQKKSNVTYEVDMTDHKKRKRTFHVNALKQWNSPVPAVLLAAECEDVEPLTWNDNQEEKTSSNQLSPNQQRDLKELKKEFADVISDIPGRTDVIEHSVDTGEASPVRLPPYRIPQALRDTLREEIKEMLTQGIIVPSTSEWAAPIILVPKKDGSKRLCVDFRRLNHVTKADPYPIPRVEELIDRLGNAKYITALDLTKGYWQVPVEKESQKKTAFITPFGKYEFTTMPFGLMGAPSTFQRLMDKVLEDVHQFAAAYLDDVIIHSDTWEQHVQHLTYVFQNLRKAGLRIKEKKCQFAKNCCNYLGHVVGEGKVRPEICKIEAVRNFKRPQTKKEVRAFLGLAGYYRRFIKDFATIAAPLSDLTKASASNKVEWKEEQNKAFVELKKRLTAEPILRNPDFSIPFILQTDASDLGIGSVLTQVDDQGEEHPVAFASRKLLPRERRYAAVEKECLAVVEGIRTFRVYLEGRHFQVQTDHRSLEYLHKMRDSNGRLSRWSLYLQPYDFSINHRPGRQNGNADGLSRENSAPTIADLKEGEMSG